MEEPEPPEFDFEPAKQTVRAQVEARFTMTASRDALAADWRGDQCTSGPLLAALRRAVADSGSMPWLVVMPSRSRWSPQRYCSVEMLLAMAAAAATTRGNWPAGASANAWCRAAICSAVDGEPGWLRSAISRATELNT